jgi:SAM-dependent methyltransferase
MRTFLPAGILLKREEAALRSPGAPHDAIMSDEKDTVEGFFCPSRILIDSQLATKKSRARGKKAAPADISFFDWLAPHYDRLQPVLDPGRFQIHSVMLDILNVIDPQPRRVLELGCRTGLLTQQILDLLPDAHVWAVDNSLAMLQAARENLDEFTDRVTLAMADFRDPWEEVIDDPIDIVVHYSVLNHLPHDSLREIFTRIVKILRPGGWFLHGEITEESLPEPVRRIAADIRNFQKETAVVDLPDGRSLLEELDRIRRSDEVRGGPSEAPTMPEQQVAWLIGAGFEFAVRVFQDWRISLFLARKPD